MMQWRNKCAAVTVLWLWPMAAAAQNLPMLNMGYSGAETDVVGPLYERLSKSCRDFPTPEPRGIQNVLDSLPSPKARGARAEDFIDAALMEEIRKSGLVERLQGK